MRRYLVPAVLTIFVLAILSEAFADIGVKDLNTSPAMAAVLRNEALMHDAAADLRFVTPQTRAVALVTHRSPNPTPVAILFGYTDNEAVCADLVKVITTHLYQASLSCEVILPK